VTHRGSPPPSHPSSPDLSNGWVNPLLTAVHERHRQTVLNQFPELRECQDGWFLSLYAYCDRCPEHHFSRQQYRTYLEWLRSQHGSGGQALSSYLHESSVELDRAFLFLAEINSYDWHDSVPQAADEYDAIRFIDQVVHPAYLRLAEAVFFPFARLVAFLLRVDRHKNTEGLDLYNVADELQRAGFADLTAGYHHGVRNAIAHGRIVYRQREIEYHDRSGGSTLSDREIVALFDDLLDICNAMALALRVYLLTSGRDMHTVPLQVLLAELQAQTQSPWWRIEGCVSSELREGQVQLILYARPDTGDYLKVMYATVAAAALAARLAPGFDRYFFSLRSGKGWPGWAAFDGHKLASGIAAAEPPIDSAASSLEQNLVFYVPPLRLPRPLGKAETILHSIRLRWPLLMSELSTRRQLPRIRVRAAKIHRNGRRSVLNASVVITSEVAAVDKALVRNSCPRIVRAALRAARSATHRTELTRYLPLGYARIAVFSRDFRQRRLESYGLGADLIGTIGIKRIARIRAPDIFGSTPEEYGPYHIAWNAAWVSGQPMADE